VSRRRAQLSLYLPAGPAEAVEAVRCLVDPVQHHLIPAHVTLCREDELGDEGVLRRRLDGLAPGPLTLGFGPLERFLGHGLLLRCVEGAAAFRALRRQVLGAEDVRELEAHLTLAHPRNPRAPGHVPGAAAGLPDPLRVTFTALEWIAQEAGGPWRVRSHHALGATG
jgi:hypothetical protein